MATERKRTIKPAGQGGDYSSLSAWEAGEQADLVALDEYRIGEIDGDWTGVDDTTRVQIDGWTTDATRYITIQTTVAARHDGKWNNSKYRLIVNDFGWDKDALRIVEQYVTIDGLQIQCSGGGEEGWGSVAVRDGPLFSVIKNNIIKKGTNVFSYAGIGFETWHTSMKIFNNIIYGFPRGIYLSSNNNALTTYIDNNTIVNCTTGFEILNGGGIIIARNNIVKNCTTDYSGTFSSGTTNNISEDGTSPGANPITASVRFVDESIDDYRLSPYDTVAQFAGTNLYSDANNPVTTDLAGNSRGGASASFDIGASHATTSIRRIMESGGDYTSLAAWESAQQRDLTANNKIAVAEIDGVWTTADTTNVDIDGWTTNSSNYIIVRAVENNAVSSCKWDASKYRLDCIYNGVCFRIQEYYTRIQRIQMRNSYTAHWSGVLALLDTGGFSRIEGCTIIQNVNGFYIGRCVDLDSIGQGSGPVVIRNCFIRNMVAYDGRSSCIENYEHPNTDALTHYIYNNTLIGGGCGIKSEDPNNAFCCKNNLIYGQDISAFITETGGIWTGSDYNATDDNVGLGSPNERLSQTFTFVDAAGGNYDLSPLDKGAKGFGANLSNDSVYPFNHDIDGRERVGAWDIGADQITLDRLFRVSKLKNVKRIIGGIS